MAISSRTAVFFLCLALASRGDAAVDPSLPRNIAIAGLNEHGDLLFVLYENPRDFERGYVVDPKSAPSGGEYQLRPSQEGPDNPGPPIGELFMIGVSRRLMAERKNKPDPKWLLQETPGVVRVSGELHNTRIDRSSARHAYRLETTEKGLQLTLTNPEVLERYAAEKLDAPAERKEPDSTGVLQLVIAAGVIIALLAVLVMRMRSKHA